MAQFFAGNPDPVKVDPELMQQLTVLGDDFYVFVEVEWDGRNGDIAILRASDDPGRFSTLISTEVKHFSQPVRGICNGRWEQETAPGIWTDLPTSGRDTSPYWQAVNTADAMGSWLYNYQRLYREDGLVLPPDHYRVWPDLLIISPPGVVHQLPLSPANRFGKWFEDPTRWVQHLLAWTPRVGTALTAREIEAIAEILHLTPCAVGADSEVRASVPSLPELLEHLAALERQLLQVQCDLALVRSGIQTLQAA